MALTNTKERYGSVAQIFHWLTAVLIIGLLIVGSIMHYLPQDSGEAIARKVFVYSMHKTIGVTVLLIAVLRVIWAITNPHPKPLHPERKLETFAAETVHWALYIAILVAPLTGLLHHAASEGFAPIWWPFGQNLPFIPKDETLSQIFGAMHWIMAIIIALCLVGHIGGALKHAILDKDETLARMLPGKLSKDFSLPNENLAHKSGLATALVAFVGIGVALSAIGGLAATQQTQNAELQPLTINTDEAREGEHPWQVVEDQSSLKIRISQLGSPVEGEFESWNAQINLDPENLDTAFIDARINIESLQLGSVSDQAKGPEFLDAESYPEARFLSDFIWLRGDGAYDAEGLMEIGGVQKPFILTFSLNIDGDRARGQAYAVINRIDFGIGAEGYNNEDSVAFAVEIALDLVAAKQW
ncbi:MAG: cytochrome b/b6 domain-containing protein [Pseudomonadota bacterium]